MHMCFQLQVELFDCCPAHLFVWEDFTSFLIWNKLVYKVAKFFMQMARPSFTGSQPSLIEDVCPWLHIFFVVCFLFMHLFWFDVHIIIVRNCVFIKFIWLFFSFSHFCFVVAALLYLGVCYYYIKIVILSPIIVFIK